MDDFLSKPIHAADLFAAIERAVSVRGVSPTSTGELGDSDCLLDPVVLLAACGGGATLLGEICQRFRSDAPTLLSALCEALGDCDAPRLQGAAHKFHGTISAFSTVAGEVASELEDLAALGHVEVAGPLVGRLESMVGELIRQVDGLSLDALRRRAGVAAHADTCHVSGT
jgi:hypothetical protein